MNKTLLDQAKGFKALSDTCASTQHSLQYSQKDIGELQGKCAALQEENTTLRECLLIQESAMRDVHRRLDEIEQQLAVLDNKERKKNLLLEGIQETPQENSAEIAVVILSKLQPGFSTSDVDNAYKINRPG